MSSPFDKTALMSESAPPNTPAPPPQRRPFYSDLTFQVLIGMALGVTIGALWPSVGKELKPLGDVFIRLIQMCVGLIIFCTVTHGIASVRNLGKVGRIALKAMIYFEVITSLALVIGLVTINVLHPGVGMHIDPAMFGIQPRPSEKAPRRRPPGSVISYSDWFQHPRPTPSPEATSCRCWCSRSCSPAAWRRPASAPSPSSRSLTASLRPCSGLSGQ